MPVFLRTVLAQNVAQAADAQVFFDLPVNPLSCVLVTLRGTVVDNDTTTPLGDMYNSISNLGIAYRGQDVIRGSLTTLAVMNAILTGYPPWGFGPQDADGETVSLTVPICFSRVPYSVVECFPAVRRGDLRMDLTVDTLVNNFDLVSLQIETVELLDITPERHLKYTTAQRTFSTTGVDTVRLPIGNPLLGVLLVGSTTPNGALNTATWEQLRTKVDNVETLYAATNWQTLHGELLRRIHGDVSYLQDHRHRFNGAAAAFDNSLQRITIEGELRGFAYLDFDPLRDNSYMLETAGRADVVIQRDVGTADTGGFIPVELVTIQGAGA